jgi:hypothetical protein
MRPLSQLSRPIASGLSSIGCGIRSFSVLQARVPNVLREKFEEGFSLKDGVKYLMPPEEKAISRITAHLTDLLDASDDKEVKDFLSVIGRFKRDKDAFGLYLSNMPAGEVAGANFASVISKLVDFIPLDKGVFAERVSRVGSTKDGITVPLDPHQDVSSAFAAQDSGIDLISLVGIRLSGDRVRTYVLGAGDIYDKMSEKTRAILSSPIFTSVYYEHDERSDIPRSRTHFPIFYVNKRGARALSFNENFGKFDEFNLDSEFKKEEVEKALQEFRDITLSLAVSEETPKFCIEESTMFAIRNDEGLHGREGGRGDRDVLLLPFRHKENNRTR